MRSSSDTPRRFRNLAVDDDESIRRFVERVLRQPGHEVRIATDGLDALRVASADGPFDLLLTDLAMPGMRGDELARRLRYTDPSLKVLYLTGYSDRLFEERPLLWDQEAFIDKPVTVPALLEAVSLLLTGCLPPRRPPRVTIPGVRARFGDVVARLDVVSVTGGRIRVGQSVPIGSVWPFVLYLPNETVSLRARVVSCERQEPQDPDAAAPEHLVAVAFVEPSADACRALQQVSGALVPAKNPEG
jgi:CheY-like chemotaxis protein